jgi:hypothetical protein
MMPSMGMPQALPSGPDSAKKAMAALMSALTTSCECEACKILRGMAQDLKVDLLR